MTEHIKKLIAASLLFLSACDDGMEYPPSGYECENGYNRCSVQLIVRYECQIEKLAAFIVDCAKAANPMSDEEGEDLVRQCDRTGKSLYCVRQRFIDRKNQTAQGGGDE